VRRRPPTQVEVVDGLIRIERVRAWANATAVAGGRLGGEAQVLAAGFAEHSRTRAGALRTGLEALGSGLDGPAPLVLAGEPLAADLAGARDEAALLRVLARLERVAIDTYARSLARLEVPELISTAASAMGGHAQQLAALRLALGDEVV